MIPSLLRGFRSLGIGGRQREPQCRVLFVCLANICRSPTAEAVFRHHVEVAGLADAVQCASAGTQEFYPGAVPDGRARAAALRRGYDMSRLRARRVNDADFERFDMILAMDKQNMTLLAERCPSSHQEKLQLFMAFARRHSALEVPDPYYGNARGFDLVLDMIEDACTSLLEHVRTTRVAPEGR